MYLERKPQAEALLVGLRFHPIIFSSSEDNSINTTPRSFCSLSQKCLLDFLLLARPIVDYPQILNRRSSLCSLAAISTEHSISISVTETHQSIFRNPLFMQSPAYQTLALRTPCFYVCLPPPLLPLHTQYLLIAVSAMSWEPCISSNLWQRRMV